VFDSIKKEIEVHKERKRKKKELDEKIDNIKEEEYLKAYEKIKKEKVLKEVREKASKDANRERGIKGVKKLLDGLKGAGDKLDKLVGDDEKENEDGLFSKARKELKGKK